MSRLTVVSVSWKSARYLAALLRNLREKAAGPFEVLLVDNTGGADADVAALATDDVRVVPFTPGETNGSRAHARALDFALTRIESEHALIIDPDVHVFRRGFDHVCRGLLAAPGGVVIAAGAPYPAWKVGKYHDFPSPIFCFFDVAAVRALGASFSPFGARKRDRARDFVKRQVGRAGGLLTRRRFEESALVRAYAGAAERALGVFGPDTGWLVAEAARRRGKRAALFDVDGAHGAVGGRGVLSDLSREFELYTNDGAPMLTHKYGSGAAPWRTARGGDEEHWRRAIADVERSLG